MIGYKVILTKARPTHKHSQHSHSFSPYRCMVSFLQSSLGSWIELPEANIWWNSFLRFNSQSGTHLSGLVLTTKALSLPSWGLLLSVTIKVELPSTWNDEICSVRGWFTQKTEETGHSCDNGKYQCDFTMTCNMRNMTQYYVLDS